MLRLGSAERGVRDEGGRKYCVVARSLRGESGVGFGEQMRLLDGHQWIRDSQTFSCDGCSGFVEIRCAGYGAGSDFSRWMVDRCRWRALVVLVGGRGPAGGVRGGRARLAESSAERWGGGCGRKFLGWEYAE